MLNRDLKKILKRKLAGSLVATTLFSAVLSTGLSAFLTEAYGAEADQSLLPDIVVTDETMYVNLDFYGDISKVNVVKGISSTAEMEYTDYGEYTDVLNMSDDAVIEKTEEGVKIPLKGDGKKFYYEGKLETEKVILPWSFEISYKLNGLPVKAEDLAGADGLVETDIKVTPNDNASEYMRNNMLLSCLIPIDDDKIYSVDAPGSQTQTVGDMTGVMFTALPGEEKEFNVRLGCNDYESIGVIFLIIPATMDSFDNIKDIKELKDTWRDSGDAMYDSMDSLLAVAESMKTEMAGLKESLIYMENARKKISADKNAVLDSGDETVKALTGLSGAVGELVPYVSTGKDALEKLDENFDSVVITLASMQKPLNNMFWGLDRIQDGSDDLAADLNRIKPYINEFMEEDQRLQAELADLMESIKEAAGAIDSLSDADVSSLIDEYDLSELVTEFCEAHDLDEDLFYEWLNDKQEALKEAKKKDIKRFEELEEKIKNAALNSEASEADMGLANLTELIKNLEETRNILEGIASQRENLTKIASASQAVSSSANQVLKGVGKTAGGAKMVSRELIDLTNDVRNLDAIIGMYYNDMQNSLTAMEKLLGETSGTVNSVASTLMLIQKTLRDSSDDVDESLKTGIDNSIALIDKSISMTDSISGVRDSGALMKESLDSELDKFEEENTFLNIDPSAKPISFTSEKNKSPESIQIILRSDEISKDDDKDEVFDAEKPEEKKSIFERIAQVFVNIWRAIRGIFK